MINHFLQNLKFVDINPSKKEIRNFGYLFAFVFLLLLTANFYSTKTISAITYTFGSICLGFFALSTIYPKLLRPAYRLWMTFGKALSWFNIRLILAILFYGIISPISLFFRLTRRDVLNLKLDKKANSYLTPMTISRRYKGQF
ncbi:MAG: hypothetical protein HQK52_01380 [Oligoflexia bacterium]|nr:hypothetical protein [Oligoflexia bacterium]